MKRILIITLLLFGYVIAQEVVLPDTSTVGGKEMAELQLMYNQLNKDRINIDLELVKVEFAYTRATLMQEKELKAREEKK